jgi:hypothetical protein
MKRPLGVVVIGVLMLLEGLPLGLLGATALAMRFNALPAAIPPDATHQLELVAPEGLLTMVLWAGLGVLLLLGGIGILLLRPWAWLLAMVLQGVTLANLLYGYSAGRQDYPGMALGVVVVFYLNSRSVRLAFNLARQRATGQQNARGPSVPGGVSPAAKTPRRGGILKALPLRRRHRPTTKELPG